MQSKKQRNVLEYLVLLASIVQIAELQYGAFHLKQVSLWERTESSIPQNDFYTAFAGLWFNNFHASLKTAGVRLRQTKQQNIPKSMFCDFLLAFRVLELIKPEASLKQSSYPTAKYPIFVFACNSPPNTLACYVCNELTCQSEDKLYSWCFTGPEQ